MVFIKLFSAEPYDNAKNNSNNPSRALRPFSQQSAATFSLGIG